MRFRLNTQVEYFKGDKKMTIYRFFNVEILSMRVIGNNKNLHIVVREHGATYSEAYWHIEDKRWILVDSIEDFSALAKSVFNALKEAFA
jgi:hypothetical protein